MHKAYTILILFCFLSCSVKVTEINPKKRPVKFLFIKKSLGIRNAYLHAKYVVKQKKALISPVKRNEAKWVLSFSDEFDSLDLKKWRPGQPWGEVHPDNLHQYYDPEEVKVKDGLLYLGGRYKPKQIWVKDSLVTVPYAIGLINSDISFKQKYGYFEIRSKNPSGAASWPAFWLTGANRWPPEIDIFEMYGRESGKSVHKQYYTIHWGKADTRSRGYITRTVPLKNNSDTVFHTYACEWNPGSVRFFTDGRLTGYIKVNSRLRKWLDDEMVVIINNCFEAKYLKYLPKDFSSNQFIVDWVRVYRRSEILEEKKTGS